MSRVLPILFNTEMVRAILDERKTATRRIAKGIASYSENGDFTAMINGEWTGPVSMEDLVKLKSKYQPGDILYVRETWQYLYELDGNDQIIEGTGMYYYAATDELPFGAYVDSAGIEHQSVPWRPSIHMPKDAARIWLRVTDVWFERLHDMTLDDFLNEGVVIRPEAFNDPENAYQQAKNVFINIWDPTVKKTERDLYGWDADPYVLATEFERCEKPESSIISEGSGGK